jgi:hypothetical protein
MPKDHAHDHGDCCHAPSEVHSRRGFLTLAGLSAGVFLLTPSLPKPAEAGGGADILLLTCMDYRLVREVSDYMHGRGLSHKYDHIILAGASLGAVTEVKTEWNHEFWDHVQVAKDLHHIKKIMVIDHRDCGAYKVFLGKDYGADPVAEKQIHSETLRKLAALVKEKHPDLEVELLLMSLDGSVEAIPA